MSGVWKDEQGLHVRGKLGNGGGRETAWKLLETSGVQCAGCTRSHYHVKY